MLLSVKKYRALQSRVRANWTNLSSWERLSAPVCKPRSFSTASTLSRPSSVGWAVRSDTPLACSTSRRKPLPMRHQMCVARADWCWPHRGIGNLAPPLKSVEILRQPDPVFSVYGVVPLYFFDPSTLRRILAFTVIGAAVPSGSNRPTTFERTPTPV